MIDLRFLQTAVGSTRVRTQKAVIGVELNKGRTFPLLQLALDLRHNRKTRRNVGHVLAAFRSTRRQRWLLVLQKQVFSLYNSVQVLTYPRAKRATGASYGATMTQCIRCKLAMAGECTINAPPRPAFKLHTCRIHLRDSKDFECDCCRCVAQY